MASPTAPTKATEPKRARPSGGGWAVGRCCTLFSVGCVAATVAAIASVLAAPLGQHWMRDRSLDGTVDELPYALTYAHNASDAPPASASRSRRADFPRSKSFFQCVAASARAIRTCLGSSIVVPARAAAFVSP